MRENVKYPIKYAVLELRKSGGASVCYKDITLGYIVSKCYVMEVSIKNFPSGNNKVSYKVVFPFKDIDIKNIKLALPEDNNYYIGEKTLPSYDANGEPYPIDEVSDLFESYEEAKKEAEVKNQKFLEINKKSEDIKEQLTICQKYEKLVSLKTVDMNVTSDVRLKEVVQLLTMKK